VSDGPEPVRTSLSQPGDARRFSPSTARNREPIRTKFLAYMPHVGHILEIGSGTGEHGVHITAMAPDLTWHFSDPDPVARASIRAWIRHAARPGLLGPYTLHADAADWGDAVEALTFDGLVAINVVHIAPFETAIGLFAGARRRLRVGGRLFLYGPYGRDGTMAPSNAAFSEQLRARDPRWGVRDLEREIVPAAAREGLVLHAVVEMPANNLCVVFEKSALSR
jgi:SAM-dependent methyltransferase